MTTYAILNLPATYTVSEELVLSFLPQWVARYEETVLGMFDSRVRAQHQCVWHCSVQQCLEEA